MQKGSVSERNRKISYDASTGTILLDDNYYDASNLDQIIGIISEIDRPLSLHVTGIILEFMDDLRRIFLSCKNLQSLKEIKLGLFAGLTNLVDFDSSLFPPSMKLERLVFRNIRILPERMVYFSMSLQSHVHLKSLSVVFCPIGTECAGHLADALCRMDLLESIDIRYSLECEKSSEYVLCALKSLSNIKHLFLSHNNIHNDAAKELGRLLKRKGNIETLELSSVMMNNDDASLFAKHMKNIPGVKRINLSENKIKSIGIMSIASGLATCTGLERLELQSNPLFDEGVILAAGAITGLVNLKHINLSNTEMFKDGFTLLISALKSTPMLEELHISNNCLSGAVGPEFENEIKHVPMLTLLKVTGCYFNETDLVNFAKGLRTLKNIKCLDISWNIIGHESFACVMESISQLTNMEELCMDRCDLHDAGIEYIARYFDNLSKLKILRLEQNGRVTGDYLALAVRNFPLLEDLYVTGNSITYHSCSAVYDAVLTGCFFIKSVSMYGGYTDKKKMAFTKMFQTSSVLLCSGKGDSRSIMHNIPTSFVHSIITQLVNMCL